MDDARGVDILEPALFRGGCFGSGVLFNQDIEQVTHKNLIKEVLDKLFLERA